MTMAMKMTMTIKEVAETLGCTPEAVKKWVRDLFPDLMKNGIQTRLTEQHVTLIKQRMIPTTQVVAATTDLEMMERAHSVLSWMAGKVQTLQEENDRLRPIAAAHQTLTESEGACTMAELAKNLGIGEYKLFEELRDMKILIGGEGPSKNLPFQDYMNRGWFRVRAIKIERTKGAEMKRQTLVTAKGQSEIAKLFTRQLEASK